MLVVVANPRDPVAREVAARWGAGLLTERDLSVAGWRHQPASPGGAVAVVEGRPVPLDQIEGVLNRLPAVHAAALPHIAGADRSYVAREMSAFLVAWLAALPCPVFNRPAPGSGSGLDWNPVQWIHLAARLGVAVHPVSWHVAPPPDGAVPAPPQVPAVPADAGYPSAVTVTVVGRRCFGTVDRRLADQARRLARAAGLALLAVVFDGPGADGRFLGADTWPDVSCPAVADAVLASLGRRRRGHL